MVSKAKAKPAPVAEAKPVKKDKAAKSIKTPTPTRATKATKAATAPTKPVKSSAPSRKRKGAGVVVIGADQRRHYVEVAAFFIAEQRGFAPGDSMADWLAAEAQVERLIAEGKIGR